MFLSQLYKFNKSAFLFFFAFIIIYAFINYNWGAVATPVYQYGMFSTKFYLKDTQTAFKIYTNDKLLDISNYHFAERDMLLVSLENYIKHKEVNASIYTTMRKIPGLDKIMKATAYSNNISDTVFTTWYKRLIKTVTKKPVEKLEIYTQKVHWLNGTINEITPPQKIINIVTN